MLPSDPYQTWRDVEEAITKIPGDEIGGHDWIDLYFMFKNPKYSIKEVLSRADRLKNPHKKTNPTQLNLF